MPAAPDNRQEQREGDPDKNGAQVVPIKQEGDLTMFLLTKDGIREAPRQKPIKSLFCRHAKTMSGESCSASGLQRISGSDIYEVCTNCGKILRESHTNY